MTVDSKEITLGIFTDEKISQIITEIAKAYCSCCPSKRNIVSFKNFLLNTEDDNEWFIKTRSSKIYSELEKATIKELLKRLKGCKRDSLIVKEGRTSVEVTSDNKAFLLIRRKRARELYFNPDAKFVGDFFCKDDSYDMENIRLAEKYIEAKGLDLRDYLFVS